MPKNEKEAQRMAEIAKPEDEKTITENTTPANETPTTEIPEPVNEQINLDGGEAPPPEKAAEETVAQAENPSQENAVQAENPAPGDNVVTYNFNQKNSTLQEAGQTEQEKKAPEAAPPEEKPARRGRPPKAKEADAPASKSKDDKSDKEPKTGRGSKSDKSTGEKSAATEKAEPEAPTPPPEPTAAPRAGEQEQIVYINLSELHPFKDPPFQVKQDAEGPYFP
jgi:hypothetical protein